MDEHTKNRCLRRGARIADVHTAEQSKTVQRGKGMSTAKGTIRICNLTRADKPCRMPNPIDTPTQSITPCSRTLECPAPARHPLSSSEPRMNEDPISPVFRQQDLRPQASFKARQVSTVSATHPTIPEPSIPKSSMRDRHIGKICQAKAHPKLQWSPTPENDKCSSYER